MPGSGKSTIGKKFSKEINFEFQDSDEIFEREQRIKIGEFFTKLGEPKFRETETKIIQNIVNAKKDCVFAVGGGAILNNGDFLKKNTTVIYIDRKINDIWKTMNNSRPLVKSKEDLQNIYNLRSELYKKYSHCKINHESIESTISKLLNLKTQGKL